MNEVTKMRNKLNEDDVQTIRTEYTGPQRRGRTPTGPTMKELGERFGVSAAQICRILKHDCWKPAVA
jgi:hypothetical protein